MRSGSLAALLLALFLWTGSLAVCAQNSRSESQGRVLSETEMMMAGAEANRLDVVIYFLNKGLSPDATAKKGYTALMVAAANGNTSIAELLLARGADIDKANDEGWTALMEAVLREQVKAAALLLRAGVKVNLHETRQGRTPLMIAARSNTPELITMLLSSGAKVNVSDAKQGLTALHLALGSPQLKANEIVAELLVAGADAGRAAADGFTPLMEAVKSGKLARLTLVLSEKPDVSARTIEGVEALALAAEIGHAGMVRRLLNAGARALPAAGSIRPLPQAVRAGSLETVKLLVEHKADVNEPGGNGKTPLILAAQNGHEDIISYLLERGAEVNGRNAADGTTALMWAANTGRARIVELLLESGGDARLIAKDGWSAGEAARMAGHDDIAAKLDRKI